jgi:hypothetical protein
VDDELDASPWLSEETLVLPGPLVGAPVPLLLSEAVAVVLSLSVAAPLLEPPPRVSMPPLPEAEALPEAPLPESHPPMASTAATVHNERPPKRM